MNWQAEIVELHEFFQEFFLGAADSLDRADAVLAADFAIVGPDGVESTRDETMQALHAGHGHTASLTIRTSNHTLKFETGDMVVASYIEHHELASTSNHRLTTAIFSIDESAPNGVLWRRVHETWLPAS